MFAFIIINVSTAFAGPNRTTYQAKIIKPDGFPLEAASVNFRFTILDPVGTCILYAENYSSIDMSSTGGLISFALGSGVKTFPVSATTFENVFSNITPALSCDAGGPPIYNPSADDTRKIVMQFHDGNGWQTLPAMSINAVPYAMYANDAQKLGGVSATSFVQTSMIPSCGVSEAVRYNGATFSCITVGGSGGGGSVTSGSVITALGYTPANGASVTTLTSNLNSTNIQVASVSSTVFAVSSTVSSLSNSVSTLAAATAASFSTITSSQWNTSGTTINYMTGNVGIGTAAPFAGLTSYKSVLNPTSSAFAAMMISRIQGGSTNDVRGSYMGSFIADDSAIAANYTTGAVLGAAGEVYLGLDSQPDGTAVATNWNGTVNSAVGNVGFVGNSTTGTGAVNNARALSAEVLNLGTGAIRNAVGLHISAVQATGNDPGQSHNAYGIYIDSIQATGGSSNSAYSIYSNSSAPSYFAGNVGIDVSTPTTRLDIAGENSASRTLRVKNFDSINGSSFFSVGQNSGSPYLDMQRWIGAGADHNATRISMDPGGGLSFMSSMSPNGGSGPTALELQTYGTNMVITGAGNVGIGRSSPTAKLELAAGTSLTAPLKFNSGTLLTSPQSGTIEYDGLQLYYTDGTNTRHALASNSGSQSNSANNTYSGTNTFGGQTYVSNNTTSTNSTTGALVVSGGVGIGGALNVAGQINSGAGVSATGLIRGANLHAGAGSANSYKLSAIGPSGVATDLVLFGIDGVSNGFTMQTTASNTLTYSMLTGSGSQGFYQDADGHVGIGTAAPSATLDVSGRTNIITADPGVLRVTGAGPGYADGVNGVLNVTSQNATGAGGIILKANSTFAPNAFVVVDNGNVGVGVASPAAPLDVAGVIRYRSPADIWRNGWLGVATSVSGTTEWGHLGGHSDPVDSIRRMAYYSDQHFFTGNVGIGTTAPVAKLDVAGQIRPQMGTPTTDSAGTSVDFVTGNTQMATFTSCPGNALTVNLYSVHEGGSYSLILTTPSGCVVSFTGTNAAYGAGGGVAVSSFKFPGGVNYSSTAEPSVYSFLRGNNIVFGSQVVDFR